MEAKEKAIELVYKMHNVDFHDLPDELAMQFKHAKQCAIIAVDEILNLMIKEFKWDINHNGNIDYWQNVKIEIEKL